jgi:phage FluMu protein Com
MSETKYPACKAVNSALATVNDAATKVSAAAEKISNKVTTGAWEDNKTNDEKYPGCAAVNFALIEISNVEQTANKVSAAEWDTHKASEIRYPSCKAVNKAVDNLTKVVTTVSVYSTNEQLPTAKAVYSFGAFLNPGGARGHTVSGGLVTADDFWAIMGYCLNGRGIHAANNIHWFEAAQYCAYKTLASSDVPQAVKDHITRYYAVAKSSLSNANYSQVEGDKCCNYLKYALITPKCWRLPTSEEWTKASGDGTITDRGNAYDWCMDGNGLEDLILGGKNIKYGNYLVSRITRGGRWYVSARWLWPGSRGVVADEWRTTLGIRLARTA